jgi:hypothetical protein
MEHGKFNLSPLITDEASLPEGEKIIKQMSGKEIFFCKIIFAR